jgi:hypothetical protein
MLRQASKLISYGANEELVIMTCERLKAIQRAERNTRQKEIKWNEKEYKVKQLLGCYGKPKIKDHFVENTTKQSMKHCEVEGCQTRAVRFVWVTYEAHAVMAYMCLSHYRVAEAVIFCYS